MKNNVKQTDIIIPTRLVLTCCGLVVCSGCSTNPTITPAEEWLKGKRPPSDRPGTLRHGQDEAIPKTTPDMFGPVPQWLPGLEAIMHPGALADGQGMSPPQALREPTSEASTIRSGLMEGGAECNAAEAVDQMKPAKKGRVKPKSGGNFAAS